MNAPTIYKKVQDVKGKYDLISIGELLTDYITTDDLPLKEVTVFEKFFGGSPANIIFHMTHFGMNTLLMTKIGDDEDGKYLFNVLQENGINTDYIRIEKGRGTTKSLIRRNTECPDFEILRGADTQLSIEDLDLSVIRDAKIIHTNAFTLAEEPVRTAALRAIEKAYELDKLISFDPNYREKVWPNKEQAMEVFKRIYPMVDLTKPSLDDAREIFGEFEPEEYIEKFHELGAKIVVLSMGKNGSIISDGTNRIIIPVEQTEAQDATGAGDMYWSVFLVSVLKGDDFYIAGRKASYSATKIVSKPGALLDKTDYAEISAYMGMF